MTSLVRAFLLALGQLGDAAILKVLAKSMVITIAVFCAIAWALNASLPLLLSGWLDVSGDVYVVASILITVLMAWFIFRIIALAVIQFFADEVVRAVERKHYPSHADTPGLPFKTELRHSMRAMARAIGVNLLAAPIALLLLFTGIGTALVFWAANAFLLGRELQDMVWLRHQHAPADVAPVSGLTRFALGGAVALLLAIPFANLVAPILGAAAATHLVHNRKLTSP